MIFLPLENITLKTKLSPSEVAEILQASIVGYGTKYDCVLDGDRFRLRRIVSNPNPLKNPYLPTFIGVIISDEQKNTLIKIKVRMHTGAGIFIFFWMAFLTFGSLLAYKSGAPNSVMIIPFTMLFFMYALIMIGFKFNSRRSEKDLKELFKAESI